MLRALMTVDQDHGDEEEAEELADIQMDIYDEEEPKRDSSMILHGRIMSYSEGSGSHISPSKG